MRSEKENKSRLTDLNPLVQLSLFISEDSPFSLAGEVQKSVDLAMNELKSAKILPEEIMGSYLTDDKGVVTNLEIHKIPEDVAWNIYHKLVGEKLGGFVSKSESDVSVGLPHPVNEYGRSR